MTEQSLNKLYTIKQIAATLQMSEQTIYRKVIKGEIPAVKMGKSWRFRKEDIDKWIEKQQKATQQKYNRA